MLVLVWEDRAGEVRSIFISCLGVVSTSVRRPTRAMRAGSTSVRSAARDSSPNRSWRCTSGRYYWSLHSSPFTLITITPSECTPVRSLSVVPCVATGAPVWAISTRISGKVTGCPGRRRRDRPASRPRLARRSSERNNRIFLTWKLSRPSPSPL